MDYLSQIRKRRITRGRTNNYVLKKVKLVLDKGKKGTRITPRSTKRKSESGRDAGSPLKQNIGTDTEANPHRFSTSPKETTVERLSAKDGQSVLSGKKNDGSKTKFKRMSKKVLTGERKASNIDKLQSRAH